MEYSLGLDIGTSSIGWCCLTTKEGQSSDILGLGVRIFPDGRNDKSKEPLCVARRIARSSRRRLKRFKQRQKQLIKDMQEFGLFPTTPAELKELEHKNPYELRCKALYEKISLYELGRVLFHLNQRRGFLSNRKEEKDVTASTKTAKAIEQLNLKIKENGCQTLGEYMYKTGKYRYKNATDNTGKLIINEYPNRKMYQDEFNKIWEIQQQKHPDTLVKKLKDKLYEDIFYQRPLQKQETGFCSLEPNERRAPLAYPITQKFRIMTELANIRINNEDNRSLSKEEREALTKYLNNPPLGSYDKDYIISFENILNYINLPLTTELNLAQGNRKGLKCNSTNILLTSPQTLDQSWHSLSDDEQNKIIDILQDYSLQNDEIKEQLLDIFNLSEEQLTQILKDSLLLQSGFANYSAVAMGKLVFDMEQCGTDLTQAITNTYGECEKIKQQDFLPHYQEIFTEALIGGNKEIFDKEMDYDNYMGRITNVSVHIALNQLRQLINDIIKTYGKPQQIVIELGREMTKGKKALKAIEDKQKENANIMAEARDALRKINIPITSFNIEKYKVWRNINPKDATQRMDIYTGQNIKITELFSPDYEIEHILPYSWSYDDSYNNKIITRAAINRQKKNTLPYEFFSSHSELSSITNNPQELKSMDIKEIEARAEDVDKARGNKKKTFNYNAIKWRFSKNAREIFNRNNKNMARDLTDMQYMTKLACQYLSTICDKGNIIAAKGQITDILKNIWEITDTIPTDHPLWQVQKWQKDDLIEKKKQNISAQNPELNDKEVEKQATDYVNDLDSETIHKQTNIKKDRSVHYHHALDAFALANINHSLINFMSSKELANESEEYQEKHPDITLNEAYKKVLKQRGKLYAKPYDTFDKDELKQQIRNIIVSYKNPVDKLKLIMKKAAKTGNNLSHFSFASITKAGAFGFRGIKKIKNGDMDIEFSARKDGQKKTEKKSLSCMIPVFRTKEQKQEFLSKYVEWQRACVRKKHIGTEAYNAIEQDFINTFTKDKTFKWHESDGNYGAEIYQIPKNDKFVPNPKEAWSVEIISNYHAFERRGQFFWKDIYPTAKRITTLHINDIVEATFDANDDLADGFSKIRNWVKQQFKNNPETQQLKLLFRVKKMTGGSIYLRPLHIAQEDNGDVKSWQCSIGKFKQYQCRKVCITPTGKVLRG